MKKTILFVVMTMLLMIPVSVFATGNTFDVYSPADGYTTADAATSLTEAVAKATSICTINPLVNTTKTLCDDASGTWAPSIIVIAGDDLEVSSLDTEAVVIVSHLALTITGPVTVRGAATLGDAVDAMITVTGAGKATVTDAQYQSYIGNADTFAFDTSETGSSVSLQTIANTGDHTYGNEASETVTTLIRDLLHLPGAEDIWTGYFVEGKVILRENLGLLGKDILVVNSGEVVIPNGVNLDSRYVLEVRSNGKITVDEGAKLYNVGSFNNDGTITVNGELLNGYRNTNAQTVEVGIGEFTTDTNGKTVINNKLTIAAGTNNNVIGTLEVAENATITNPGEILLNPDGTLVNKTHADIVVKRTGDAGVVTDETVPGVPLPIPNPKTGDNIISSIILSIVCLLAIAVTTVTIRNKRFN